MKNPFQRRYSFRSGDQQWNVVFVLIAVNIIAFVVTELAPRALVALAMNPVLVVRGGQFWQPFTYMFVHANISHILFNMLGLMFFGTQVERQIGSAEFLVFYSVSGLVAGLFSLAVYWFTGSYQVFLLGASGAVYAVLLAFATFFPHATIYVFGVIPVKAPILVLAYTVIEIVSQISSRGSNVAHLTHLAGFGAAFLYLLIRLRINPIAVFLSNR